ncbi:hypothetical protein FOT98_20825 [Bacillus sp. HY001]|nr:hypothetical protein FOT98_20825 [Bacillus sp. HY001]
MVASFQTFSTAPTFVLFFDPTTTFISFTSIKIHHFALLKLNINHYHTSPGHLFTLKKKMDSLTIAVEHKTAFLPSVLIHHSSTN